MGEIEIGPGRMKMQTGMAWLVTVNLIFGSASSIAQNGTQPQLDVETIVGKLRHRMTIQQVDEILRPATLAVAYEVYGGSGAGAKYYHLVGDREIQIYIPGAWPANAVHIGKIRPKGRWYGLSWETDRDESFKR